MVYDSIANLNLFYRISETILSTYHQLSGMLRMFHTMSYTHSQTIT